MAIIICKECNGKLSSSAKACPHCGSKGNRKVGLVGWLAVLLIVLPGAWGIGKAINADQESSIARASEPVKPSDTEDRGSTTAKESCRNISEYAKQVMIGRQGGMLLSEMPTGDNSLLEMVMIRAYDQPRYSTEAMVKRAIVDYQNQIYLECIKEAS